MERSRSRLDPLSSLQVRDRDLQRQVDRLRNRDRSLPSWIEPTLAGTWVNVDANNPVSYWRSFDGIIFSAGQAKLGTIPSTLFTFPEGFRPGTQKVFPLVSNGLFGYATVATTGVLTINAGNNTWVDISVICFRAEQ